MKHLVFAVKVINIFVYVTISEFYVLCDALS